MKLEHGTPREIEGESMRIIGWELEAMGIVLPAGCEAVVKRAIHTTADFDYARNLRFTPGAVEAGVAALRAGTALVTDTNMALSGVNRGACEQLGVGRFCYMADPQVAERARTERTTRAAAAVDCWASEHPAGIFAASGGMYGGGNAASRPGHRGPGGLCQCGGEQGADLVRVPGPGCPGHCGYGPQGGLHSGGGGVQRAAVSGCGPAIEKISA